MENYYFISYKSTKKTNRKNYNAVINTPPLEWLVKHCDSYIITFWSSITEEQYKNYSMELQNKKNILRNVLKDTDSINRHHIYCEKI